MICQRCRQLAGDHPSGLCFRCFRDRLDAAEASDLCAGLPSGAPASSGPRLPYAAPAVVTHGPCRVNVAALLGQLLAPGRPPGVPVDRVTIPLATLVRWRELASDGAPCARECGDLLCELARAVLAFQVPPQG